jgi:hypothetical protein
MVIPQTLFVSSFLTSLDRFGIKNILFMTLFFLKRSMLATIRNPDKKVRFSNGKNKMAAILFIPFENRTKILG